MPSLAQYIKQNPHYVINQSQISSYYAGLSKQPQSIADVLVREYGQNELGEKFNAFSAVAFRPDDGAGNGDQISHRCTVCNVYYEYDGLYVCPRCD